MGNKHPKAIQNWGKKAMVGYGLSYSKRNFSSSLMKGKLQSSFALLTRGLSLFKVNLKLLLKILSNSVYSC